MLSQKLENIAAGLEQETQAPTISKNKVHYAVMCLQALIEEAKTVESLPFVPSEETAKTA